MTWQETASMIISGIITIGIIIAIRFGLPWLYHKMMTAIIDDKIRKLEEKEKLDGHKTNSQKRAK